MHLVCTLLILFLVFLGYKRKENHRKKQGNLFPGEPLKSLGKKGETLKKARSSLQTKKNKEIQKSKEKKFRENVNTLRIGNEGLQTGVPKGPLVAQCSATPATVPATPPKGATPKFLGGVARHRCYTCKRL